MVLPRLIAAICLWPDPSKKLKDTSRGSCRSPYTVPSGCEQELLPLPPETVPEVCWEHSCFLAGQGGTACRARQVQVDSFPSESNGCKNASDVSGSMSQAHMNRDRNGRAPEVLTKYDCDGCVWLAFCRKAGSNVSVIEETAASSGLNSLLREVSFWAVT